MTNSEAQTTIKSLMEIFEEAQRAVAQGATLEQTLQNVPAAYKDLVASMYQSIVAQS